MKPHGAGGEAKRLPGMSQDGERGMTGALF